MSRTKRNYGTYYLDCHGLASYEYGWIGLGGNYDVDPRDALIHGYDGVSPSYYYDGYNDYGGRENFQGRTRKFVKRRYHKQRRRLKIEME